MEDINNRHNYNQRCYEMKGVNNPETFISKNSETPTDLKPPCGGFQLAQINIVQQAIKELMQT